MSGQKSFFVLSYMSVVHILTDYLLAAGTSAQQIQLDFSSANWA